MLVVLWLLRWPRGRLSLRSLKVETESDIIGVIRGDVPGRLEARGDTADDLALQCIEIDEVLERRRHRLARARLFGGVDAARVVLVAIRVVVMDHLGAFILRVR